MGSIISFLNGLISDLNDFMGKGLLSEAVTNDLATSFLKSGGGIQTVATSTLIPIGITLCLFYFLLEMIEEATRDNFTVEHIVRGLIKLCLGVMLIENLLPSGSGSNATDGILLGIANFASALVENLSDVSWSDTITTDFSGLSIFSLIGNILALINQPVGAYLLMYIAVWFVSITRNITIAVMAVYAPIAMADIFHRGLDSNGVQFVKRYAAVCLQIFIIGAIAVGISTLFTDPNYVSLTGVKTILIGFACASLIFKSKNMAYEMMGVR